MRGLFKIEKIREYITINKITKKDFCDICKISSFVLNKIMNQKPNFRINVLFKIVKVLNIEIKDFINKEEKLICNK